MGNDIENRKCGKYSHLDSTHLFILGAVETIGRDINQIGVFNLKLCQWISVHRYSIWVEPSAAIIDMQSVYSACHCNDYNYMLSMLFQIQSKLVHNINIIFLYYIIIIIAYIATINYTI